jgi:hypothetical protein
LPLPGLPPIPVQRARWPVALVGALGVGALAFVLFPRAQPVAAVAKAVVVVPVVTVEDAGLIVADQKPAPTAAVSKHKPPIASQGIGVVLIGGEGAQRAEILIDGRSVGYAPKRLELAAGTHAVELVMPTGARVGPKQVLVTARHTESEPLKWLLP